MKIKLILSLAVLLLLVPVQFLCAQSAHFFVSQTGNDSWSGTLVEPNQEKTDGPFQSIDRAKKEIQNLKQAGKFKGAVISLREGIYHLKHHLLLEKNDSGMEEKPVIYEGWKNEKVILSGAIPAKGFQPVTDQKVLSRVSPEAGQHLLQLDLSSISDFDPGTPTSDGKRLELFFGQKPMKLARWPNEGFTKITEVTGNEPFKSHGIPGNHEGRFVTDSDRMEKWSQENDLWLHGYWFWDWSDAYQKVKNIESKSKEIFLVSPYHHYGYRKGQKFYVLNALSEIDSPGEWYLDRQSKILYFWPPGDIDSNQVTLSSIDHILKIDGVSHVTFRNLIFEQSRSTLVRAANVNDFHIKKSMFRNSGSAGIYITGTNSGVEGCDLHSIASSGITISGGNRPQLEPGNLYAVNNHIHNFGRVYRTYRPAIAIVGVGNRAQHNLIHNGPHNAIQGSGNNHLIEFNEVYDVCYETGDVGAYYMGRDWTQRGIMIRHNYFHHIKGPGLHGAMAVYLDDAASGTSIIGNVFYEAGRAAFIGGGRDNVVKNNIFVDCHPSVHVDNRGMGWMNDHVAPGGIMQERLKNMPYQSSPWKEQYPELVNILDQNPEEPRGNIIVNNISVGGTWKNISKGIENMVTMKDNLINTDPGFLDQEGEKFQLKDISPAYKIGFKRIPIEKIGLYEDPNRFSWPVQKSRRTAQ